MWGQRWFSSGSSGSRTRYAHKALAVAWVDLSLSVWRCERPPNQGHRVAAGQRRIWTPVLATLQRYQSMIDLDAAFCNNYNCIIGVLLASPRDSHRSRERCGGQVHGIRGCAKGGRTGNREITLGARSTSAAFGRERRWSEIDGVQVCQSP
jgi:hypothetical protein